MCTDWNWTTTLPPRQNTVGGSILRPTHTSIQNSYVFQLNQFISIKDVAICGLYHLTLLSRLSSSTCLYLTHKFPPSSGPSRPCWPGIVFSWSWSSFGSKMCYDTKKLALLYYNLWRYFKFLTWDLCKACTSGHSSFVKFCAGDELNSPSTVETQNRCYLCTCMHYLYQFKILMMTVAAWHTANFILLQTDVQKKQWWAKLQLELIFSLLSCPWCIRDFAHKITTCLQGKNWNVSEERAADNKKL